MKRFAGLLLLTVSLSAARPPAAAAQPVGSVFQVNSYTTGAQDAPAVSIAPGGGFVIVWESDGQDGDGLGVFAQRYTNSGVKLGGEFQVNGYTTGPQAVPAVASAADGSFVVAWQGYGQGGDYQDIFARRFSNAGVALGGEFQADSPFEGYEGAPAVAVTSTGFVVVWDDYNDVFARRYDTTGTPQGPPFLVNTFTVGFQGTPSIAATADGGFVVGWEGDVSGNGTDYDVFAQRFDSSGTAVGTEFQVNSATLGYQYGSSIAPVPGGGFVVVWESYPYLGANRAVFGQRFDGSNGRLGGEFPVAAATGTDAGEPHVGADQSGDFVVVWSAATPPGAPAAVLGQAFDSSGGAVGGATVIDSSTTASAFQPVVSVAPDGRYVVAWRRDAGDGSEAGVFAQRFAAIFVSPTPTATATVPTATRTPPRTATATGTATHPPTATASATGTATRTATATRTSLPTVTVAATRTATAQPSATRTPTATTTATASPPPPATATGAASVTGTASSTATRSRTATASATASATTTASATATSTVPPTPSASRTETASATPTRPLTPPGSVTATASATVSATATVSAAIAPSATPPSATPTRTAGTSPMASTTATVASTSTGTGTVTSTPARPATPTPSHTATATEPAATETQTETPSSAPTESATATATAPMTATAAPCDGDCNRDGQVTVNELITAVNIALGTLDVSSCPAADRNGDGEVTVSELIRAVNRALVGC
jgi:hypothetical protein